MPERSKLFFHVIVTSGSINRLELYRRLGVREVWFWERDALTLYSLQEETPTQFVNTAGYEPTPQSRLLPELDVDLLKNCIQNPNPLAAAKAFRQGMRSKKQMPPSSGYKSRYALKVSGWD